MAALVFGVKRLEQASASAIGLSTAGGPLNEGTLEGDEVKCPWHGSRFARRDGSVRGGPTTLPVPIYEMRVENGRIQIILRS